MELTLQEFKKKTIEDLDAFIKFYEEEQKKTPEYFPETLGWSDWFEQFIIFDNENSKRESTPTTHHS